MQGLGDKFVAIGVVAAAGGIATAHFLGFNYAPFKELFGNPMYGLNPGDEFSYLLGIVTGITVGSVIGSIYIGLEEIKASFYR